MAVQEKIHDKDRQSGLGGRGGEGMRCQGVGVCLCILSAYRPARANIERSLRLEPLLWDVKIKSIDAIDPAICILLTIADAEESETLSL